MPKPGGGHSSGISLGDALRLPKRHPAWRRREAQPGSCMGGARRFSGRRQPSRGDTSRMNREVQVRMCVQERLACSAGDKPAGAKVRRPVVRMAGWRETKTLKPIDEVSFRGDYESPGRNESKRRSGLEGD